MVVYDNWFTLSAADVLGTVAAACASSSQPEAWMSRIDRQEQAC
jgi:hypothetical protein